MNSTLAVTIRHPASVTERRAIFRLRYEVFAGELHRGMTAGEHRSRLCTDGDDAAAELYGAYVGAELVGTARWIRISDAAPVTLTALLDNARFTGQLSPRGAVASRLAVAPAWRGTPIALQLLAHAVCDGLREGIEAVYLYTRPSVWPFYEKLGCQRLLDGTVEHPDLGPQLLGYLNLTGPSTMRRIALVYGRRHGIPEKGADLFKDTSIN